MPLPLESFYQFHANKGLSMTRQSAANFRKSNGHLVHLALEVEEKVNHSRRDHKLELMLDQHNKDFKTLETT